jgi:hypothetical protein
MYPSKRVSAGQPHGCRIAEAPGSYAKVSGVNGARSRRLAARHKAEVGLRVVDGHQPGLGPRWRHGVGTLAAGRLGFRGTVGGVRFLRRAPITIDFLQIDRDAHRTTGLREAWSVRPGIEVVQLITATARLDLALPGAQIDWAIEELLPPGASDGRRP